MSSLLGTVQIEGEVLGVPQTTMVTKIFWDRLAVKCIPGVLLGFWIINSISAIQGFVLIAVLFVVASFVFRPLLDVGGGVLRGLTGFVGLMGEVLDGLVGPHKGQVPVQVFTVQVKTDTSINPVLDNDGVPSLPGSVPCTSAQCGYKDNPAGSVYCGSCGQGLSVKKPNASPLPPGLRQYTVRIEGQIIGGQISAGQRINIEGTDQRGTIAFVRGCNQSTGAQIVVRRNAETGPQA